VSSDETDRSWPTTVDVGALVEQVASSFLVPNDDYIVTANVGAHKRTILLNPRLESIP
jgi:hypothetical protein